MAIEEKPKSLGLLFSCQWSVLSLIVAKDAFFGINLAEISSKVRHWDEVIRMKWVRKF